MRSLKLFVAVFGVLSAAGVARAGDLYEVTATDKKGETVRYKVKFGGGRAFEMYTAFDPKSKTFVYLTWKRGDEAPKPAGSIWDHRTGETVPLYKFPDVEQPLPVIPSMDAIKVCPMTGDKKFKAEKKGNFD